MKISPLHELPANPSPLNLYPPYVLGGPHFRELRVHMGYDDDESNTRTPSESGRMGRLEHQVQSSGLSRSEDGARAGNLGIMQRP